MEQASLRRVAGLRIVTQNVGDLRERPVISRGVLHHVARDKANMAAINLVGYPNCCDYHLLFPLNHQLHLAEAHNHVLFQHNTTNLVLLTQTALATNRPPYNLDKNTAWMDGLIKQKEHGCHSGRRRKDRGGFFSAGAHVPAPSTPTRGAGAGATAGAGIASGFAALFWRL